MLRLCIQHVRLVSSSESQFSAKNNDFVLGDDCGSQITAKPRFLSILSSRGRRLCDRNVSIRLLLYVNKFCSLIGKNVYGFSQSACIICLWLWLWRIRSSYVQPKNPNNPRTHQEKIYPRTEKSLDQYLLCLGHLPKVFPSWGFICNKNITSIEVLLPGTKCEGVVVTRNGIFMTHFRTP